jgi:predicted DsbA family dithiol-disulfide isomerase
MLYSKKIKIKNRLYLAINCSRWNPEGRVLRVNPPLKSIDKLFSNFRKQLKQAARQKFLKKLGQEYVFDVSRLHESWLMMPQRGKYAYKFTDKDIQYSKSVLKAYRDFFARINDWNDLELLIKYLKKCKVQKPTLIAQLIFAAWQFRSEGDVWE